MNQNQQQKLNSKQGCIGCLTLFIFVILIGVFISSCTGNNQSTQETMITLSQDKRDSMNLNQFLGLMVTQTMGEKSNSNKPRLIRVEDGDKGIKDVYVNGNENLTGNMTTKGMLFDAKHFFKVISKDEETLKLKAVSLMYFLPLVDKYGKVESGMVMAITLNTETMKKINWDNFSVDNFEVVTDTFFVHPALQK